MRQTSKRARRSRALMIVIFVLLAALVIWGLTALLGRLLHYGTNTTVSAKDHEAAHADRAERRGQGGGNSGKYI